jgi:hypothetical protein
MSAPKPKVISETARQWAQLGQLRADLDRATADLEAERAARITAEHERDEARAERDAAQGRSTPPPAATIPRSHP